MKPRERFLKVFAHELPDRIPSVIDARKEVQEKLVCYYKVNSFNEVLQILGAEDMYRFKTDGIFEIAFPDFEKKAVHIDGPWLGGGRKYIQINDRTFQDEWGVIRKIGSDGKFVQWLTGPLVEVKNPDEYDFPGADRIIENSVIHEQISLWKQEGILVRSIVSQPYKTAWLLRGMENLLVDYILNRRFVEKLYDRIYALYGEILRRSTKAGADVIGFDGDIATQSGVVMGPRRWRKIDKPRLAAVIRSCKEINNNVKAFIHSDGNITEILPDLIEIGFDIIDPIQPECMNPEEIKKKYGTQITLHRCGSLQRTLPFGTPAENRDEVRNLIKTCGYNGGLVLGASNTISYDVPIENIVAWYETVRDYDLKKI